MNTDSPNLITTPAELEHLLQKHGINPTRQRMAIGKILFSRHQHLSAEQIHERLKSQQSQVSKATVYNTLQTFVEQGLLKEIFIDPSCIHYDTNIGHHHHFYNVDTSSMIDINEDLSKSLSKTMLPQNTELESCEVIIRVRNRSF